MINTEAFLFTVIGIIMANSFLLMSYTWKFLTNIYLRLPIHLQRPPYSIGYIIFRDQRMMSKRVRGWAYVLGCLWAGCIFLGISIFMNTFALLGISTQIWNWHIGPFTESNYNQGKFFLSLAVVFFASGISVIGIARICQFLVFTTNRQNSIFTLEDQERTR